MIDLTTIRKKNNGQPDGYWKATTAALCDEVERLRKERRQIAGDLLGGPLTPNELQGDYVVRPDPSLDAIRRMDGDIPPWIVRMLCDRVERVERDAASWRGQAVAWSHNITALTAERDQLRATVKELRA